MKKRVRTRFILASGSPRRSELIKMILNEFEVIVSKADESTDKSNPAEVVMELSEKKAMAVVNELLPIDSSEYDRLVVIGADTIVSYNGEILGKPENEEEAKAMLSLLSDRTHQVYTGVSIVVSENGEIKKNSFSECTEVTFGCLDKYDIEDYVATKDPLDKAGAYGIQGVFAKHIKSINGEYNNVVGLPVCRMFYEMRDMRLI